MARRVVLLGWEGADWRILQPLIEAGRMPHLARLVASGVAAEPVAPHPLIPPMAWTSAVTGLAPEDHGVLGWNEPRPDGAGVIPASSLSRRAKALWNFTTQAGLSTHALGHFASHPAEPIRGVCVSDRFGHPADGGAVHPPELAEAFAALRVHPSEIDAAALESFLPGVGHIDPEADDRPARLAAALASAATGQAMLTWILASQPWDFVTARFDGLARIHRDFLAYHRPHQPIAPGDARDLEIYRGVAPAACEFFDLMLGTVVELAGPDANVVVFSPYGFRAPSASSSRPSWSADEPWTLRNAETRYRPRGVLAGAGPALRRGHRLDGMHLWSLAPTILALLGLPHAEAMLGAPRLDALKPTARVAAAPTGQSRPADAGMHPAERRRDPLQGYAELQRMVELGYIDPPDDDHTAAMAEAAREQRYNLGRALLDGGRNPARAAQELDVRAPSPDDLRWLALGRPCSPPAVSTNAAGWPRSPKRRASRAPMRSWRWRRSTWSCGVRNRRSADCAPWTRPSARRRPSLSPAEPMPAWACGKRPVEPLAKPPRPTPTAAPPAGTGAGAARAAASGRSRRGRARGRRAPAAPSPVALLPGRRHVAPTHRRAAARRDGGDGLPQRRQAGPGHGAGLSPPGASLSRPRRHSAGDGMPVASPPSADAKTSRALKRRRPSDGRLRRNQNEKGEGGSANGIRTRV